MYQEITKSQPKAILGQPLKNENEKSNNSPLWPIFIISCFVPFCNYPKNFPQFQKKSVTYHPNPLLIITFYFYSP